MLKLGSHNSAVADLIKNIIATPEANIKHYRKRLLSLQRSDKLIAWDKTEQFVVKLEGLLDELRECVTDAKSGIMLLCDFFRCDQSLFDRCEDPVGRINAFFSFDATRLFTEYAMNCDNKVWVADQIFHLLDDDEYLLRILILKSAIDFLPVSEMHRLIDMFLDAAQRKEGGFDDTYHWLYAVQLLAKQLKEAELFEDVTKQLHAELSPRDVLEIAEVFLEAGKAITALSWVDKIIDTKHKMVSEQDELLLGIFKKLEDVESMTDTAWRIFRRHRTKDMLTELLSI